MKLTITYDRKDAINDILIYLYSCGDKKEGIFHDVHAKSYELGIMQHIDRDYIFDNIKFSLIEIGDYKVVGYTIQKYKKLILEGEEADIHNFCKKAFVYNEERINNSKIFDKLNIFEYDCAWTFLECCEKRSLESLNLPKTQVNDIVKDITHFTSENTKKKYKSLGIPHSRTYMFYGPPGTGKTSLIKSIASTINYSIGVIEFDKDLNDKTLKRALACRPHDIILVFEDIDCLFDSRKKSDEFSTQVTFSGLLNTFDGVVTHENLIVIFTTNHLEILDKALKRRVDYFLKFDYATKTQIKNMYTRFYPDQIHNFDRFYDVMKHVKITPNILQKFFTKHLYDEICEYAHELCTFANGEIAVENLENFYT